MRAIRVTGVAAVVAALAATASSAAGKDVTIGFVRGINASPVFAMMECGVRKAAREHGARVIADGPAEWNVSLQLPIDRAMIAKHPDALILDPDDDTASAQAVREAQRFGIRVVLVDNAVKGVSVPFLGMDDVQAGEVAGRELAAMMKGRGTVLLIGTYAANYVPQLRMQGYRRALARYPRITILQKQFAENSADKVSSIVRSTLAAHPDLGGIIADGDIVGEFTGATLSSLKRTDIPAVAFDATPAEQKWLASGALDGLVAWDPYALGYQGATVAFDLLARKPVPTSIPRQSYVFVSRRTMKDPQLGNHLYRYECTPKA